MLKKNNWESKRRKSLEIPIGLSLLFVYCGECTEPNYFNKTLEIIKDHYEKESKGITRFDYKAKVVAYDPSKMADSIKKIVSKLDNNFDEVYVVFDKDSFKPDNFDNAINKIEAMTTSDCKYCALWSNECIELWFVLHFEYLQSQLTRNDYFKKLEEYLDIKYDKNIIDIAKIIIDKGGSSEKAISYSKKLIKLHETEKSYSKKYPATNVYVFFQKYNKYLK